MEPLLDDEPLYRDAHSLAAQDRFLGRYLVGQSMSERFDRWLNEMNVEQPLFRWAIKRIAGDMRGGLRGLSIALWQPGPPFVKKLVLTYEQNLWMWYLRSHKLVGPHNRGRWYRRAAQRSKAKRVRENELAQKQSVLL